MKLKKAEIIWLIFVVAFYVLYNLPFVPRYGESVPALVHGALTLIPLWISVYIGLVKVLKIYKLKGEENEENAKALKE